MASDIGFNLIKLYNIQPTIGKWLLGFIKMKRVKIVLSRLRIGNTHLTYSNLLKNESLSSYNRCRVPLTVGHIIINCHHISQT